MFIKSTFIPIHTHTFHVRNSFNPLNAELNPICNFLALLGAHPIFHVSRIRVKLSSSTVNDFGNRHIWSKGHCWLLKTDILKYLRNYKTPWSIVLLQKLTGPQLVKKHPAFTKSNGLWLHSQSPTTVPFLNKINPVHVHHPTL